MNFTLQTDASGLGCGAKLLQNNKVVEYCSHKFSPAETRYSTNEQEGLALFMAE